jgi:predicted transposase/invertase (TIGR01784 family)
VYLQLPLFKKKADECETFFERWLYVLKDMDVLDELPEAFQCESFKKLKEVSNIAAMSEEERDRYEAIQRRYWDAWMMYSDSVEEGLAKGLKKGLRQGRAEGLKKGLKKGIKQGLEQGRAEEHTKVIEMARTMKSAGMSAEVIANASGLSVEEVSAL